MSIELDIVKKLGDFRLETSFHGENEVIALLGPSGCGKSMTLKCIAGIETPDEGRIVVDGVVLFDSDKQINLTPQQRRAGLLFQNYALFPHMTVEQNILAGAKREKNRRCWADMTAQAIAMFELEGLEKRYPDQLSGGQQQRVALARILVSGPDILLLDEPFSALDSHLRFAMEHKVRQTIRRFGKTVILVSHDRDEVFRLADKILVMNDGRTERFGTRHEVFRSPGTRSGAVLTGCKNISRLKKLSDTRIYALDWGIELELERAAGDAAFVGIRMHDIAYGPGENTVCCTVTEVIENPFSYTVMCRSSEQATAIGWETEKALWHEAAEDRVILHLPSDKILLLKG